jgi:plastocyanin
MLRRLIGATALAFLAAACGSNDNGMPPSPPPAGSTITITSSGVSPKSLVVSPGTQVTFVNNDSRNHLMNSDQHPDHLDCPAINDVGALAPGQSKQTGNLNVVRTCGYHDHDMFANTALQGTITITIR